MKRYTEYFPPSPASTSKPIQRQQRSLKPPEISAIRAALWETELARVCRRRGGRYIFLKNGGIKFSCVPYLLRLPLNIC